MRGSLGIGLVIGLVVGAAGMYLALRPPWAGGATQATDAGVVAAAPGDAGTGKPKHKRPHHRPGGGGGGAPGTPGYDSDDQAWLNSGGNDTEETLPPQLVQLSAADRALEWRGDDVTPGKQTIDMTSGAESRSLENSEIQSTISSQSGPVQSCVVNGAANTDLKGTIMVKMVVDGAGHVTRSKVQAPHYLHEHGLLGCVQRALGKWKFPSTGAPTLVTLPVNLT